MPVRLFSGARSSGISFNQLHRTDHHRVKQQLICPADNQVLERSDIVKGYEYRKDEYVIIDPEEIKKIEPKTAKTMEILEFVKTSEVDPGLFRVVRITWFPKRQAAVLTLYLPRRWRKASTLPSPNSPCTIANTPFFCVRIKAE